MANVFYNFLKQTSIMKIEWTDSQQTEENNSASDILDILNIQEQPIKLRDQMWRRLKLDTEGLSWSI